MDLGAVLVRTFTAPDPLRHPPLFSEPAGGAPAGGRP
jgi:hypothetical protein